MLLKIVEPPQTIEQFLRERQWISVLDSLLVQLVVVDTKPKTATLLWCKQHRGSIGGYRWSDVPMLEHILDLFPCLFKLEWADFIDWPVNGRSIVLQFDFELMTHSYRW